MENCVSFRRMIFLPFAPTVLNFLHIKLHVINSFSSLFSSHGLFSLPQWVCHTVKDGDGIFLLAFVLLCLASLLICLILIAVLSEKCRKSCMSFAIFCVQEMFVNINLCAEHENVVIMFVL